MNISVSNSRFFSAICSLLFFPLFTFTSLYLYKNILKSICEKRSQKCLSIPTTFNVYNTYYSNLCLSTLCVTSSLLPEACEQQWCCLEYKIKCNMYLNSVSFFFFFISLCVKNLINPITSWPQFYSVFFVQAKLNQSVMPFHCTLL